MFGKIIKDSQQPTCLSNSAPPDNMVGLRTHRSPQRNSFSIGENELAKRVALTNNSGTPLHTTAVSRAPTPAVALASAAPVARYTDEDL